MHQPLNYAGLSSHLVLVLACVYELVLEYFANRKGTKEHQPHTGTRFLWAIGRDSSVTCMLLLEQGLTCGAFSRSSCHAEVEAPVWGYLVSSGHGALSAAFVTEQNG